MVQYKRGEFWDPCTALSVIQIVIIIVSRYCWTLSGPSNTRSTYMDIVMTKGSGEPSAHSLTRVYALGLDEYLGDTSTSSVISIPD